jgi:hypothetical protein
MVRGNYADRVIVIRKLYPMNDKLSQTKFRAVANVMLFGLVVPLTHLEHNARTTINRFGVNSSRQAAQWLTCNHVSVACGPAHA